MIYFPGQRKGDLAAAQAEKALVVILDALRNSATFFCSISLAASTQHVEPLRAQA
jgi:hypothetical protein